MLCHVYAVQSNTLLEDEYMKQYDIKFYHLVYLSTICACREPNNKPTYFNRSTKIYTFLP